MTTKKELSSLIFLKQSLNFAALADVSIWDNFFRKSGSYVTESQNRFQLPHKKVVFLHLNVFPENTQ